MAKVTYTVNDDGGQKGSGVCDITASSMIFGTLSGNYAYVGLRFTSVAIAQAATIRKATLKVHCSSISTSSGTFTIKIEDVDNAAALNTTSSDLSGRTYSATTYTARMHDLPDGYKYFDVTALVQAIVNRGGWSSGNAMHLSFQGAWIGSSATIGTTEGSNASQLSIIHGGNATSYTTFGSNTGSFTNPTNATADDGVYATTTDLTTATHTFYNWGFAVSGTDTIDDVVVKINANVSTNASKSRYGMEISVDGGTNWATQKFGNQHTTTDEDIFFGGDPDAWSILPTASQVNDNTNFRARIQNDFAASNNDANLDYLAVIVYSTTGASSTTKQLAALGVG